MHLQGNSRNFEPLFLSFTQNMTKHGAMFKPPECEAALNPAGLTCSLLPCRPSVLSCPRCGRPAAPARPRCPRPERCGGPSDWGLKSVVPETFLWGLVVCDVLDRAVCEQLAAFISYLRSGPTQPHRRCHRAATCASLPHAAPSARRQPRPSARSNADSGPDGSFFSAGMGIDAPTRGPPGRCFLHAAAAVMHPVPTVVWRCSILVSQRSG